MSEFVIRTVIALTMCSVNVARATLGQLSNFISTKRSLIERRGLHHNRTAEMLSVCHIKRKGEPICDDFC